MAVQVTFEDPKNFNYMIYGDKNPGTVNFLENQYNRISNTLTSAGQEFFNGAKSIYDSLNSAEALRLARAAVRKVGSLFQREGIRYISDLHSMQTAPLSMQRFIMAEPTVRKMYHEQCIDGYSETYIDIEPTKIGEAHYDYRRVMDGIVTEDEDGDSCWSNYIEILDPNDRNLDITEQVDILNTWEHVAALLQMRDRDPTSSWDNKM